MRLLASALLLFAFSGSLLAEEAATRTEPKKDETAATGREVAEKARAAAADGIRFLVSSQNEDGSWGYHAQQSPFMIFAPVPGAHRAFKVAVTGLALLALREVDRLFDEEEFEGLAEARGKGIAWLVENAVAKRSQGNEIYICWAYAYGLQAIARYLERPVEGFDEKAARETAKDLLDAIGVIQTLDGGWTYLDFHLKSRRPSGPSMSFTTATVLLAMFEAREVGLELDEKVVAKAKRSLQLSRTPEGHWVYSFNWRYYPSGRINRPQGSLTRTPCCDLAYRAAGGPIDVDDLERGVRNLVGKRAFARMALHRPVPHESWFSVSGYFYLFGYFYAAEAWRELPAEAREELRGPMLTEILVTRHPDGSFWDYPLYGYHKPYGTGYAVHALIRLLEGEKVGGEPGK